MPNRWVKFSIDSAKDLPRRSTTCLYALYEDTRLVYIGKTTNIFNRFRHCHRHKPTITHAKARPAHPRLVDYHEKRLIWRLKPAMNVSWTGRYQQRGAR